jgi:hypothetical protein
MTICTFHSRSRQLQQTEGESIPIQVQGRQLNTLSIPAPHMHVPPKPTKHIHTYILNISVLVLSMHTLDKIYNFIYFVSKLTAILSEPAEYIGAKLLQPAATICLDTRKLRTNNHIHEDWHNRQIGK